MALKKEKTEETTAGKSKSEEGDKKEGKEAEEAKGKKKKIVLVDKEGYVVEESDRQTRKLDKDGKQYKGPAVKKKKVLDEEDTALQKAMRDAQLKDEAKQCEGIFILEYSLTCLSALIVL